MRQKILDSYAAARYILSIGNAATRQKPIKNRSTGAARHAAKEAIMTAKKKAKEIQHDVAENAHQIWLAGLGAVAMAQEGSGKLFKNLVEKGEGFEKVGKDKVDQAKGAVSGVKVVAESYWETFERTIDDKVTAVIHRIGVPTKDEIEDLTKKVEDLTVAVDNLRTKSVAKPKTTATKQATTTKKATAKKTPAKK